MGDVDGGGGEVEGVSGDGSGWCMEEERVDKLVGVGVEELDHEQKRGGEVEGLISL